MNAAFSGILKSSVAETSHYQFDKLLERIKMFRRFTTSSVVPAMVFKYSAMLQSNNNNNQNQNGNFKSNNNTNSGNFRNNNRNRSNNNNYNANTDNNNTTNYNANTGNKNTMKERFTKPTVDIQITAAKKEDGGKMTLVYANNNVMIKFSDQLRDVEDLGQIRNKEAAKESNRTMLFRPQVQSLLYLSPLHTVRLVGFLEEPSSDASIEICSRNSKALFKKTGEHSVNVSCITTIGGGDGKTESWSLSLDAAETLLMSHFLNEAIHANQGFRNH